VISLTITSPNCQSYSGLEEQATHKDINFVA